MSYLSPATPEDLSFMQAALEEGRRGIGLTCPNPPVGAVVVRNNKIIGAGYHYRAGKPHAEIMALAEAIEHNAKLVAGSTLYVTLEPCCTRGRTPPCTESIIDARIARVVYGTRDPYPAHQGRADHVLAAARIAVTHGVMEAECKELIRPFSKWIATGLPYVIAKVGQSLDGRITRPEGESQWITSDAARAHAMRLRGRVDAIIVGAETVRRDNPRLTLRNLASHQDKPQPLRVIMTKSGQLPADANVFTDEHRARTLVMPGLDFPEVLRELGRKGVHTVLVEGGGMILGRAFATRMVDEVAWYIAPRLCGGGRPSLDGSPLPSSVELKPVKVLTLGNNVCFSGFPVWSDL
jgi:diaminohydroxyphosphoribosylaminopyrimidine deaminase / 5-amino-6-(5-phosphoribosylamino)uracil reductase